MATSRMPSLSNSPLRRLLSGIGPGFQQVAEATQGTYLQAEGSQPPPQAVHADLDRRIRRWIAAAREPLRNRLLADDPSDSRRQRLQQRQLAGGKIDVRPAQ